MQQRGLAGPRRGNNQTARAFANRRHDIHHPRRHPIGNRLEHKPFFRLDHRQVIKRFQFLVVGRVPAVDRFDLDQLRAAFLRRRRPPGNLQPRP